MNIKDFNKEAIKEALKELKGLEMKVTDADGDEICVYHESTEVMINDLIPKNNKKLIDEIDLLIAKEINIANSEGQPTSRLTSLAMKINKLK